MHEALITAQCNVICFWAEKSKQYLLDVRRGERQRLLLSNRVGCQALAAGIESCYQATWFRHTELK